MKFKQLGEIAKISSGGTPSRSRPEFYRPGQVLWVKSGELLEATITDTEEKISRLGLENSSAKLVDAGTVLLAMYGANVGRVGILGVQAATNQAVATIQCDTEELCNRYLFYFLIRSKNHLVAQAAGGAQQNINQNILSELWIPLPSLDEQRELVGILDKASVLMTKQSECIKRFDTFTRQVFFEFFGNPLENPHKWKEYRLDEVGTLDRGRSRHRPRNAPGLYGGAYPFIQTGDIANSGGYIRYYEKTYSEEGLRQSKLWPEGTLCITIAANIGKTAILTFPACFPDSVVGFTPNDRATTEFIQVWLSIIQERLERDAPESAQKNINLEILNELVVPCPSRDGQLAFVEIVQKAERLKSTFVEADRQARSLFDFLLVSRFSDLRPKTLALVSK